MKNDLGYPKREDVDKQNVTLSLPKEIFREAKHLAVDRGIPLSGSLVEALEERVKRLSEMRQGLNLGTKGNPNWRREDLHAR